MKKILALLLVAFTVSAQANNANVCEIPSSHYQKVSNSEPKENKILEFFWYGCPHCFSAQQDLLTIKHRNPATKIEHVPAVFDERWKSGAQMYYALQILSNNELHHQTVFHGVHRNRQLLTDQNFRMGFIKRLGIDAKKLEETMQSFTVESKIRAAQNLVKKYNITSTPSFVVKSEYVVSPSYTKGLPAAMQTVDKILQCETM